ncbi:hypothetical protein [Frankia sp. R82]|uniref:hypothetical protein n=1 Tax=Frankia sp. R82 TaxID=2950553 RepID=UPI0020432F37|nr:hypothetical protein [Frankia sp. R82]MCM3884130.1 hypothetical protein [Frankia sp. R82]
MPDPNPHPDAQNCDGEPESLRAECLTEDQCYQARYDLAAQSSMRDAAARGMDKLHRQLGIERQNAEEWRRRALDGAAGKLQTRISVAISILSHGGDGSAERAILVLEGRDVVDINARRAGGQ